MFLIESEDSAAVLAAASRADAVVRRFVGRPEDVEVGDHVGGFLVKRVNPAATHDNRSAHQFVLQDAADKEVGRLYVVSDIDLEDGGVEFERTFSSEEEAAAFVDSLGRTTIEARKLDVGTTLADGSTVVDVRLDAAGVRVLLSGGGVHYERLFSFTELVEVED